MAAPVLYLSVGLLLLALLLGLLRSIDWETRRLPRRLQLRPATEAELPRVLQEVAAELKERWPQLGFEPPSMQVAEPAGLLLAAVNPEERVLFMLVVDTEDARFGLHAVTPLTDGRRAETTTIGGLGELLRPEGVSLTLAEPETTLDAFWAAHRRSLMSFERKERAPIPEDWGALAADVYGAWVRAGVRAQRLARDKDPRLLRLRERARR